MTHCHPWLCSPTTPHTLIKKADFCSAQPSVLDVDCSLSLLSEFFWLRANHYADVYLWSAVIKTDDLFFSITPFVTAVFFVHNLYSRAGSLPKPLLDIYSKLKTEVVILFFNLVWLCGQGIVMILNEITRERVKKERLRKEPGEKSFCVA